MELAGLGLNSWRYLFCIRTNIPEEEKEEDGEKEGEKEGKGERKNNTRS